MTKLAVKDLKQIIDGNIEVYQPTEKINCTSTKANENITDIPQTLMTSL